MVAQTELTRTQARHFVERGFVVVPGVVGRLLQAAALAQIDRLLDDAGPEPTKKGPHFYFLPPPAPRTPFDALLNESPLAGLVAGLIAPYELEPVDHVQVSLILPGWNHTPGLPHIDGLEPLASDERPGTFTLLAGIMLTDQALPGSGNLWVWPGSHELIAEQLRRKGPEAIRGMGHPTVAMDPPEQVLGRAGDVLLAHYLLGHNMGSNTSDSTRKTVYFRLRACGHRDRWKEFVRDPWLELKGATMLSRKASPSGANGQRTGGGFGDV